MCNRMCVLLLVAAVTLATRGAHAQAPHKFGAAIWRAVVTAPTTKAFRAALQDLGNYTSLLSDPIDTSKLCPAVMDVNAIPSTGNRIACTVVSVLEKVMQGQSAAKGCANRRATGFGNQIAVPSLSGNGSSLPYALPDKRPLLDQFNDTMAIGADEAPAWSYYWLLVRNFYSYWQCSPAMGGRLSYRWPDGWTPVGGVKDTGVYMLLESDKKRRAFMIIMRHAEGKRLAVVVRGTETVPEWMIDFAYNRITGAPFGNNSGSFVGSTHSGFTETMQQLWPHVLSALNTYVINSDATHVAVTGHSLGAGVGTLIAYAAAKYLAAQNSAAMVDAVMFGSPAVGDSTFMADLAATLNARSIAFADDIVTHIPCISAPNAGARAMPACANTPVPTPRPGYIAWDDYAYTPGRIEVVGDDMPALTQRPAWDAMNLAGALTVFGKILASHICSYTCFTSQYVAANTSNLCIVSNASSPSSTVCPYMPIRVSGRS